jgi:adenine-specific DNA-methyltransferase
MSDRTPQSPLWWARVLGMVYVPMFSRSRRESLPADLRDQSVLLDGDKASFALASGNADDLLKRIEPLDWSWSSNLTHTLVVDKDYDKLFVRRWDDPNNPKAIRLPTERHAPEVLEFLAESGQPSKPTVIKRMLSLFRIVRSNVIDERHGNRNDVVTAFNALLVGVDAARRGLVSEREWADAVTLHDLLRLIETKGIAPLKAAKVSEAAREFAIQHLIAELIGRDLDTQYFLNPDLLIRHAAGELLQDAHIDLEEASPSPQHQQGLLFPSLDDSRPKGKLKSDAHFTPTPLARAFVDEAVAALLSIRDLPSRIEVLDPACGSGVFLVEALAYLNFSWGRPLTLRGVDNSSVARDMTDFCLRKATQDDARGEDEVSIEVKERDSLAQDFSWGSPDLILMNPPFLEWEKIPTRERGKVRDVLGDWYYYRPDAALAFISKAVRSLKPGAVLATLLPASLLETKSGLKFRAAIEADGALAIHLVGHFRGFGYFRQANVEPAFLVISRGLNASRERPPVRVVIAERGSEDEAIRELRKRIPGSSWSPSSDPKGRWEIYEASPKDFPATSWMPRPRRAVELIESLSRAGVSRVGDLFNVRLGIRTGDNSAFVLTAAQLEALSPSASERKLFRPVAENETIRDGRILPGVFVFYPYDRKGKPLFQAESELEQAAPAFYRARLLPKRDSLKKRSAGARNWWELVRPRASWQAAPKRKIVSAIFVAQGSFAYDESGIHCVTQGFGWLWKRPRFHNTDLPWAYLALLNSPIFSGLLALFSPQTRSGHFEIYPKFVTRVFLPDLSDYEKVSGDTLAALVELGKSIARGEASDMAQLDEAAARAYGLSAEVLRGVQSLEEYFQDLEKRFQELVKQWRTETEMISSVSKIIKHPAYQAIINMGGPALRLILRELQDQPDLWFPALKAIAKTSPVPPEQRSDPKLAREAWLLWGRKHGWIK